MVEFKIICPDCGAAVMTASPKSVVWEFCPGSLHHVWDVYDALMADVRTPERTVERGRNAQTEN